MGAYIYVTKPSHVATAVVEIDGVRSETEVALYRYAFKPYHWDERLNARMRFSSGALACAAAYDRSGKAVPAYGVFFDDEAAEVYAAGRTDANGCFLTHGAVEVVDDTRTSRGRVVRWVRLPKGVTEGRMPLDRRLTPTTVLQVQPKPAAALSPNAPAFWTRLADKATGEVQPQWTLVRTQADLERLALSYGVLVEPAPAGAL
jgi:hypothetical protein